MEGIEASYKFIQKLWVLHNKIFNEIKFNKLENTNNSLNKITDKFVNDIERNLENFRYNKIIANFHELYSSINKENLNKCSAKSLKENYLKILIAMMPVIPHFTSQCLKLLNYT
jgi:leucyl-tRNA synthetase